MDALSGSAYDVEMMEVSFLPVFLAGIASFVIGYVWYHPRVFGARWMRLTNVTPDNAERAKRNLHVTTVLALLASMLVAYVMSYFGRAWGVYDIVGAIELGFWCWLGFVVPTSLGMVLWEHRPFSLYALHAAYWLISFIVMALILLI